jgi:CcmD family protein
MKNFQFLFAAWLTVWAVFFVYQLSVASRISKLQSEIESLKRQLND